MPWAEQLSEALARVIQQSAILAPIAAFLGGALTALNPCVLAMIPLMVGLAAGITGQSAAIPGARAWSRTLGFSLLFVMGFALELALLFTLFSATAGLLQAAWWRYVLVAICTVVGVHLLGWLPIPAISLPARASRLVGVVGAIGLGFLFGIISLPCTGPVLILLIGLAPEIGRAQAGMFLFLYGLGHSLLLVAAGTSVGVAAALLKSERLQRGASWLRKAAGVLILCSAGWILTH